MKLKDDTTIKTLREIIGQKIMTRSSRSPIKITGIEVTGDETWFLGLDGSRKRRIKPQYISEIWAEDLPDDKPKNKRSKTPQELKEERLRKAEEAEEKKKAEEEKKLQLPDTRSAAAWDFPERT